ncbi:MAG: class I SAM-dependent methyltransferase [Candidatus Nitrosotalea sp.]|nr:class I SAM-dependent methyltransferase [Candidatus Nitrosotalea sp.]
MWDNIYEKDSSFFGEKPSDFAMSCYDTMKDGSETILELGCGQGRDSLFFASKGIKVKALDYSRLAIEQLSKRAKQTGLSVEASVYDATRPLPFNDNEFDAVYSHMLFSMKFSREQLKFIFKEIRRVLRNDGFHFFSVRNYNDKFYGKGIKVDDEIYDINGFQIRFFTTQEIENLSEGFKIFEIKEDYEEPVTLYLVTSRKY